MKKTILSKNLDNLYKIEANIIESSKKEIIKLCKNSKSIQEFVEYVVNFDDACANNQILRNSTERVNYLIGHQLRRFIWQITGNTISDNPYHSVGTLYYLESFISNYFLDDSYFIVEKDEFGHFRARSSRGYGCEDYKIDSQNPNDLIKAAKLNVQATFVIGDNTVSPVILKKLKSTSKNKTYEQQ